MPYEWTDLTGLPCGILTVIGRDFVYKNLTHWWCRCECGVIKRVNTELIKGKRVKSCGCQRRSLISQKRRKQSGVFCCEIREYTIWQGIKSRCSNPNVKNYKRYGGRGIRICERWDNSSDAFMEDMGKRPTDQHSIERKNNDGNYSCGQCPQCLANGWTMNCVWATDKDQARNRTSSRFIEFQGETKTIAEWAEILGLRQLMVVDRLRRGWSVERALTEGVHSNHGRNKKIGST